jgi:SAM-dependent methyltransferase
MSTESGTPLTHRIDRLATRARQAFTDLSGRIAWVVRRLSSLVRLPFETRREMMELRQQMAALVTLLETELREMKNEISAQISVNASEARWPSGQGGVEETNVPRIVPQPQVPQPVRRQQTNWLERIDAGSGDAGRYTTAGLHDLLQATRAETTNWLSSLHGSMQSRFNTIEVQLLDRVFLQMHELAAAQFEARAKTSVDAARWVPQPKENYAPAKVSAFDRYLTDAQRDYPSVFSAWKERLDATEQAFAVTKVGNAAHVADPRSRLFRSLVEMHACGRVLDIGCGVFGRPYYLVGYPGELVSGLDPLLPPEKPDFEQVRGISEYLPWPDAAFSTVISATALDHCMSLDRSLDEMRRVLRPGGKGLLWIDSIAGSPKYEPDDPNYEPADRFHLFHFDAAWFEPMLARWFDIVDRTELQGREFSRVMYVVVRAGA